MFNQTRFTKGEYNCFKDRKWFIFDFRFDMFSFLDIK